MSQMSRRRFLELTMARCDGHCAGRVRWPRRPGYATSQPIPRRAACDGHARQGQARAERESARPQCALLPALRSADAGGLATGRERNGQQAAYAELCRHTAIAGGGAGFAHEVRRMLVLRGTVGWVCSCFPAGAGATRSNRDARTR